MEYLMIVLKFTAPISKLPEVLDRRGLRFF